MLIEILNWAKYNPRHDVKSTTWFRLQNNFWLDEVIFDLCSDGKIVWITLLALASQRGGGVYTLNTAMVAAIISVPEEKVKAIIRILQEREKIKIHTSRTRTAGVTQTSPSRNVDVPLRTDGTETNGTDVTSETSGKKRGRPVKVPEQLSEADLAVGSEWLDFAFQEMPWTKNASWTVQGFASAIAALKKATDLNDEGVKAVLAFVKADDFWRRNAISPTGLLRKSEKNGHRKIDNILVKMKPKKTDTEKRIETLAAWVKETDAAKEAGTYDDKLF